MSIECQDRAAGGQLKVSEHHRPCFCFSVRLSRLSPAPGSGDMGRVEGLGRLDRSGSTNSMGPEEKHRDKASYRTVMSHWAYSYRTVATHWVYSYRTVSHWMFSHWTVVSLWAYSYRTEASHRAYSYRTALHLVFSYRQWCHTECIVTEQWCHIEHTITEQSCNTEHTLQNSAVTLSIQL